MKGTVVKNPYWVSVSPRSGTIKFAKLAINCLSTKLSKLRSVKKIIACKHSIYFHWNSLYGP